MWLLPYHTLYTYSILKISFVLLHVSIQKENTDLSLCPSRLKTPGGKGCILLIFASSQYQAQSLAESIQYLFVDLG